MKKKIAIKAAGMATACAVLLSAVTAGVPTGMYASAANASGLSKSETVYVNADAAGSVKNITVSDWLHSETSGATINDYSSLTDIKNVKGNEKPSVSGSNVTWQLSGSDLYYQGKSSKSLPVSVKIQYYLDGKETAPADLAGKSGKLEIKISFKNLDGHAVNIGGAMHTVYTPFICAAAFNLPSKYFSNVTTNFGKVVSDGSNQAVSFATVPGLKESLYMYDTSKVNIPDTLDVTADVKDFRLSTIMMLVSPVPDMSSLNSSVNVSDLLSKLDQLYSAGSELKDATATLNSGEQAFASGVAQLYAGLVTAGTSFDEAAAGATELSNKTSSLGQLVSGASDLYNGASDLNGGLDKIVAGLPTLTGGTAQADDGAAQLLDGLNKLKTTLSTNDNYAKINAGASEYVNYADATVYGVISAGLSSLRGTIYSMLKTAYPSADAATLSTQTASAYKNAVSGETATLHAAADAQLIAAMNAADAQTKAACVKQATAYINMYDAINVIANDPAVAGAASSSAGLTAFIAAMSDTSSSADYMFKFDKTTVLTQIAYAKAADVTGEKTASYDQLSAAVNALDDAHLAGLWQSVSASSGGNLNNANIVLSGESFKKGLSQFVSAFSDTTSDLYTTGIDPLIAGATQLKTGTAKLKDSTAADSELVAGLGKLDAGSKKLLEGTKQLNLGASNLTQLKAGIDKLAQGLGLFKTQAMSPLTSGAAQLDANASLLTSGTSQLSEGMSKFFDEGISKLNGQDKTNLNDALAVKDEMVKLANNYTSFSGTPEGVTTSVKFIIKTDEIKAVTAASSTASTSSSKSTSSRNFFQRIADFFTKK